MEQPRLFAEPLYYRVSVYFGTVTDEVDESQERFIVNTEPEDGWQVKGERVAQWDVLPLVQSLKSEGWDDETILIEKV